MSQQELEALGRLVNAFAHTRAEMDAMRTVLTAAVSTIGSHSELCETFTRRLRALKEADHAAGLASTASDDMLQRRIDWICRLVPPHLRAAIE